MFDGGSLSLMRDGTQSSGNNRGQGETMNTALKPILFFSAFALWGCTIHQHYYQDTQARMVPTQPPAARPENPPIQPTPAHLWVNGHWHWNEKSATWQWQPGAWQLPPDGRADWREPAYGDSQGEPTYRPGHWVERKPRPEPHNQDDRKNSVHDSDTRLVRAGRPGSKAENNANKNQEDRTDRQKKEKDKQNNEKTNKEKPDKAGKEPKGHGDRMQRPNKRPRPEGNPPARDLTAKNNRRSRDDKAESEKENKNEERKKRNTDMNAEEKKDHDKKDNGNVDKEAQKEDNRKSSDNRKNKELKKENNTRKDNSDKEDKDRVSDPNENKQ
jgi:hypothetical protein